MKTYRVEARLKFPSAYHNGYDLEVHASNKAEAIKRARKMVVYEGHTRMDGPLAYRAIEL